MEKARDPFWDSLKFILIFLVVYGHVLTIDYPAFSVNRSIRDLIYLFHMPLFIFVSGRYSQIIDEKKYLNRICRLIETYFVFQCLHIVARFFMHRGSFSLEHLLLYPEISLWYLQCLVYWRLMVYSLHKTILFNSMRAGLFISFCISMLSGFIPISNAFSIQRTLSFLPFFVMGYNSYSSDIHKYVNKIPFSIALASIIVLFGIHFYCFNGVCKLSNFTDSYKSMEGFYLRFVGIGLAIVLSSFVMRLTPINNHFSEWGKYTLFIYMYHLFFEAFLKIVVNKGYLPSGVFPIMLYSVGLTFFLIIISKNKILNLMMNPISSILIVKHLPK